MGIRRPYPACVNSNEAILESVLGREPGSVSAYISAKIQSSACVRIQGTRSRRVHSTEVTQVAWGAMLALSGNAAGFRQALGRQSLPG